MLRNEKMCLRKRIFWTEFRALERAREITELGVPMRAYHCPNCLQWHLTSQMVPFRTHLRAHDLNGIHKPALARAA